MASFLRFRKLFIVKPANLSAPKLQFCNEKEAVSARDKVGSSETTVNDQRKLPKRRSRGWNICVDRCCWTIGCICTTWWLLLLFYHTMPPRSPALEPPGAKLRREGLTALHPVVFVPGTGTGGLELWEGKPCAQGLFRKRLWGGTFTELFRRPLCWLEHLALDNETGLDPPGIRVRPVPGLVAADYAAPGYFVWAVLIENLAKIGYEDRNLHMAAYDWRLSFQNTEVRDKTLSRLKSQIEVLYATNGYKKVVVVPHSMGVIYFLHFLKWVETPAPMGGAADPGWCAKHIKSIFNIAPAFLGVPKAFSGLLSAEARDGAYLRAMAPGVWDPETLGFQTFEHIMRVGRTWDSIVSLLPKGGEAIWGNMDWSPEEREVCSTGKEKQMQSSSRDNNINSSDAKVGFQVTESVKYGRMISFGKAASQLHSSEVSTIDTEEFARMRSSRTSNSSCVEAWTEYDEMSRESIKEVAADKAYTADSLFDLFRFVAPKFMGRAEAHFSHGIAENLDDPKYNHYKYWSNPLETKLPDAPEIEIFCSYGVGIPTERSYVYKLCNISKCKSIPYQIDTSVDGGVYFVDGDGSVPVLTAGFMCAKAWRGKTRFNPSGMPTYVREYRHKPPANLLEGRGMASGAHVDIMGNVHLIEDILRIAAGATGEEIGGDKIHSDILRISERINVGFDKS